MGVLGWGLAALAGLVFAISRRPDSFRVTRTAMLAAPIDVLFGYVNDFHRWRAWSPWENLDPELKRTYAGPESGVGATYEWSGNGKAGAGKMTVRESTPHERIEILLEFTKPMAATNTSEFTFRSTEGGVSVTWSMHGKNDFMGKAFSLFVSMDKLVGKSFEEGLDKLGQVAAAPTGTETQHSA